MTWQQQASVLIVAAAAVACRPGPLPAARHLASGHLEPPAFPADMDLLAQGRGGQFLGSSVLFAKDAPVPGLARLVEAITATRLAKADWYAYHHDTEAPQSAKIAALTDQMGQTTALAHSGAVVQAAQQAAARRWIGSALDGLAAAGALASRPQTEAVWGAYCEAKIWELAVDPLATKTFTEHPTPVALCNDYYGAQGFFTGDDCAPAPGGRSYLSCLWKAGIARTRYFKGRYLENFKLKPEQKAATLLSWVDSGKLADVIDHDKSQRFGNAALSQATLTTSAVLGKEYKDAFVPDGGTPSPASTTLTPDTAAPGMLVSAVEDGDAHLSAPALSLAPMGDLSADAKARVDGLHAAVNAMAYRPSNKESPSDCAFDHPLPPLAPDEVATCTAAASERVEFASIYQDLAPEYQEKLEALKTQLAVATADQVAIKTEADQRYTRYTDNLRDSAVAATATGVSEALWITSALTIEETGNGLYAFKFQLDNQRTQTAHACWSEPALALAPCPAADNVAAAAAAADGEVRVTHDPASTLLAVEVDLTAPEALGFNLVDIGGDAGLGNPFMSLDPASLVGKVLRVELYPARLGEFYYYSGKLLVIDRKRGSADVVLHEGAVNLMAN